MHHSNRGVEQTLQEMLQCCVWHVKKQSRWCTYPLAMEPKFVSIKDWYKSCSGSANSSQSTIGSRLCSLTNCTTNNCHACGQLFTSRTPHDGSFSNVMSTQKLPTHLGVVVLPKSTNRVACRLSHFIQSPIHCCHETGFKILEQLAIGLLSTLQFSIPQSRSSGCGRPEKKHGKVVEMEGVEIMCSFQLILTNKPWCGFAIRRNNGEGRAGGGVLECLPETKLQQTSGTSWTPASNHTIQYAMIMMYFHFS